MRLSVRACALVVRFVIILTYIIIIVNTYSEFCRESLTKSQEKSRFFSILFTNLKFCAILFMSHKLNNRFRGIFRFIGILYPFLRILRLYGFGKNANSTNLSITSFISIPISLCDNNRRFAFFGACDFGCAHFLFLKEGQKA